MNDTLMWIFRPYVEEKIPSHIMTVHIAASCLALLLTVITTAGYVSACNNLHSGVRNQVQSRHENAVKIGTVENGAAVRIYNLSQKQNTLHYYLDHHLYA